MFYHACLPLFMLLWPSYHSKNACFVWHETEFCVLSTAHLLWKLLNDTIIDIQRRCILNWPRTRSRPHRNGCLHKVWYAINWSTCLSRDDEKFYTQKVAFAQEFGVVVNFEWALFRWQTSIGPHLVWIFSGYFGFKVLIFVWLVWLSFECCDVFGSRFWTQLFSMWRMWVNGRNANWMLRYCW